MQHGKKAVTRMVSGERASYERPEWAATAARHRVVYRFARHFAPDRRVVEIGCGAGYGAHLLAEVADTVLAIDNDPEAVAAAAQSFQADGLVFKVADAMSLSAADIRCDVLVSLQVLEHLADARRFAALIAEAIKPGGVCILSTPNALQSFGENPYHVREYTPPELEELLSEFFPVVDMYGVQATERALAYDRRRGRSAERLLALDFLRLRRILPKTWVRRIGDFLGESVKRYLMRFGPRLSSDTWDDEYRVATGNLEEALDLVAVCSHAAEHESGTL